MSLMHERIQSLENMTLPLTREPDFNDLWAKVLKQSSQQALKPDSEDYPYPVPQVRVQKVSFEAYDSGRIVGWSITPAEIMPRPTLITFHGYGGHKGQVADYMMWVLQGYTVLTFDARGQSGESSDNATYSGGRTRGWITSGILEPENSYCMRCAVDILRSIDFACTLSECDKDKIGTMGSSQGGGLSFLAAAMDDRIKLCIAEVPGSCNFNYSIERLRTFPWSEIIDYFRVNPEHTETALRTLSYIDINNMADKIKCPVLVSVGLDDDICLPETIYAAFNRITADEKLIKPCPYRGHESDMITETAFEWAQKYLMNPEKSNA